MRFITRALLAIGTVLLLIGIVPLHAQEPAVSMAQGQLVKVDAVAKTVVIRTTEGSQMQFTYTADTKVDGADEGVEGLATKAGTDVTVHFTKKGSENIATEIAIVKKP
jgi:hypothetical protein